MLMTHETMMDFAARWIAHWNARDIESVLAHFAEDAQFVSPIAYRFVGRATLGNKEEIRAYWQAGLARISTIEFTLDHASWDERRRALTVVYQARLDDDVKRACEIMLFDESGRQIRGEAFYGAPLARG